MNAAESLVRTLVMNDVDEGSPATMRDEPAAVLRIGCLRGGPSLVELRF